MSHMAPGVQSLWMEAEPGITGFRKVRPCSHSREWNDSPTKCTHLLGKGFLTGPLKCFTGLVNPSLKPVDPVTWSVISMDHQLTMTNGPLDCFAYRGLRLWTKCYFLFNEWDHVCGVGEAKDDTYALVRENDGKANSRQG